MDLSSEQGPRSIEPPKAAQVQVAATSFMSLFAIVGLALYGLPFFYDFMVRDFGWSRAQVTSGNALSKLVVGPLFGFAAGWFVDRVGPRRLMIVGIILAGTALVGLGSIHTLAGFYVFYLFNALGNVLGGPLPNQVLLSRWFNAARGRAMGFAYLGIGLGGALVPLVSVRLVQAFGWQGALKALGVAIVLIALPLALIVKESPDAATPARRATPAPPAPMGDVLRRPAFYLLMIGSMCSIAAVGGANQHLKLYLSIDHGYSQGAAAGVASMTLAASLIGRLTMGWLADRWPKKYVMLLIYLLVAASLPILLYASTPTAVTLFAIVFGIGLGGEYMVIPLMAAELFGTRVLGRAMGIVLAADGVAEATAPVLVGRLRDVSGSYVTGFTVLIAFALTGAIAIALLPRGASGSGAVPSVIPEHA
jgi:sugar phosphate permease